MTTLLAIDPGRDKCGLAVVQSGKVLDMRVVSRNEAVAVVKGLVDRFNVGKTIIGTGTGWKPLAEEIQNSIPAMPIELVDEQLSTRRARERFFRENPPRGFRKFMPRGLLVPPRPYDDYVALILAEDYLRQMSIVE